MDRTRHDPSAGLLEQPGGRVHARRCGDDGLVVRAIAPQAGSSLSPLAEELAIGALRLVAADPSAIASASHLVATTKAFTELCEIAHLPGRAVLSIDIAKDPDDALAIHLLCGTVGPVGDAAREARALLGAARILLERYPSCYEVADVDPTGLLSGLGSLRHTARVVQRRVGIADDTDEAEVLSRFDREPDSWLGLARLVLDAPRGTRLRTTLLATELDLYDRSWLDEAVASARGLFERATPDGGASASLGTARCAQRVLETVIDIEESYTSPVFVVEVAVASPEPLSEIFLRSLATSITNEADVVGQGATPLVAARSRLVGGFAIEWDPDGLAEALRLGLPLRGGCEPRSFADVVSLTEAACAFQWPVPAGGPIPTLPVEMLRLLPAPRGLSDIGVVVGRDASDEDVHLDAAQRASHVHLVGMTGTGKSTLVARLVMSDIDEGRQFVLVDPHGDLARRVRDHAVRRGVDLVVVDPSDDESVGLELFDGALSSGADRLERLEASAARMLDAIASSQDPTWTGPRFRATARAVLLLLGCAGKGHHLGEVPDVLCDLSVARRLVATSEGLPSWVWPKLENHFTQRDTADVADWASSKFSDFTYRGGLRRALPPIGQGRSIPGLLGKGQSLVVSFAGGALSGLDARLLGHLVVSLVIDECCARGDGERRPVGLYIDEAQLFPAVSLARALAEGRKFGLSLTAAHQHQSQLDPILRDALGNAKATFAFRTAPEDAAEIGPRLGIAPRELVGLPDLSAYVLVARDGRRLGPFTISLDPPSSVEFGALGSRPPRRESRPDAVWS
jgi:hypothetical protein